MLVHRSRYLVLALALLLAGGTSLATATPVEVTNFPRVQRVRIENPPTVQRVTVEAFPEVQAVSVARHLPVTDFKGWSGLQVAPVSPSTSPEDLDRFHDLGSIETAGFARLDLSLVGRLSGSAVSAPPLELVLLPDTPFIIDAWRKDGVLLLAQRIDFALLLRDKGLFESGTTRVPLHFPRYRAFLRNRSARSLDLNIYLQLGE